jgi:hypothetical protein
MTPLATLIQAAARAYGYDADDLASVQAVAERDPDGMRLCYEQDPLILAELKTDSRPTKTDPRPTPLQSTSKETDMGLTVHETAGGNFEIAPAGTHPARCYSILDMGTQTSEYQGETKASRKVLLQWELLGDERMEDGRPFTVSKRYTASLHEKAQLRKDLAAWRGRDFTPDELAGFDLAKVLGAYCYINVIHNAKGDKTFANIASLMPLPKGVAKPEGENPLRTFDLDKFDQEAFDQLGANMQAKIMATPEWKALSSASTPPKAAGTFDDLEDDVAF